MILITSFLNKVLEQPLKIRYNYFDQNVKILHIQVSQKEFQGLPNNSVILVQDIP